MNKINKKFLKSYKKGFSLIEILVVLLIIGLLTTLVAVNVLPSQDRARIEKSKADIAILGMHSRCIKWKGLTFLKRI